MLDGAARLESLAKEVVRQGESAIAMTDHGNVFGAFDFYKTMKKVGVKPIIGIEAYVAPESRFEKRRVKWADGGDDDVSGGGAYTHMTILAQNNEGLANLFRLSSLASLEGYYYKPRMDRELLSKYASGLIGTSGCPGGEIQTKLRLGAITEAKLAASELRDIFGKDNFFIEIMDHGIEIENRVSLVRVDDAAGRVQLHFRRRLVDPGEVITHAAAVEPGAACFHVRQLEQRARAIREKALVAA